MFGVLPGVIGSIQATEAIKLITGEGDTLGDACSSTTPSTWSFQEVKIRWDADCPVCGKEPTIAELIDYEQFCGVPARPETRSRTTDGRPGEAAHDPPQACRG